MAVGPDLLDEALGDLRVSGSVLLNRAYGPPWRIDVPPEGELRRAVGAAADLRAVPFHFVRRGHFTLHHPALQPVAVGEADVVICPSGAPHQLEGGQGAVGVSMADALAGLGPPFAAPGTPGVCELICGVFLLKRAPLNPMHGALPPMLRVPTAGPSARPMLVRAAELLILSLDSGGRNAFTTARLLEVFCAEALRAHAQGTTAGAAGWFRGLADPRIARAMALLHRRPGDPWTVAALAGEVALSPSRLAARFRLAAGCSPMGYLARWRMNLAGRRLRETDAPIAGIAAELGYDSLPAFGRTFKALVGQSPAAWRAGRGAPTADAIADATTAIVGPEAPRDRPVAEARPRGG